MPSCAHPLAHIIGKIALLENECIHHHLLKIKKQKTKNLVGRPTATYSFEKNEKKNSLYNYCTFICIIF